MPLFSKRIGTESEPPNTEYPNVEYEDDYEYISGTTEEVNVINSETGTRTTEIKTKTSNINAITSDPTIFNSDSKEAARDEYFSKLNQICGKQIELRIVGGIVVVEPHMYPWMAGLVYESNAFSDVSLNVSSEESTDILCGGVIISDNVVMTAAHCIKNIPDWKNNAVFSLKKVRVGHSNLLSNEAFDVVIDDILVHPNFTSTKFGEINDIAILILKERLNFEDEKTKPICLPNPNLTENILVDPKLTSLVVAGWGATNFSRSSDVLLELFVTYDPIIDCEKKFQRLLSKSRPPFKLLNTRMCARGPRGKYVIIYPSIGQNCILFSFEIEYQQ